eukprot:4803928-Pleurochrysis_carterae.AAC.1
MPGRRTPGNFQRQNSTARKREATSGCRTCANPALCDTRWRLCSTHARGIKGSRVAARLAFVSHKVAACI